MRPFVVHSADGLVHDGSKSLHEGLLERATIVVQQMRYFGLVARKCEFAELVPSATRAGFTLLSEYPQDKEARFRWKLGEPDFIFSVSFKHPKKVSIVAEGVRDILGLVLVSHSHAAEISVETKPWLGGDQLGPNTMRLREILLGFPEFVATPAWAIY
jgi:hypothetical protein